jgi:hypothetical protein
MVTCGIIQQTFGTHWEQFRFGDGGAGQIGLVEGSSRTIPPISLSITHRGELRTRHVCITISATTSAGEIILAATLIAPSA